MLKELVKFAEAGEPSLLALHVAPDLARGSSEKLVFALPILSRDGDSWSLCL